MSARICDEGLALDTDVAAKPAATAAGGTAPKLCADDWPAHERVRKLARELKRPNINAGTIPSRSSTDHLRFEPPHDLFAGLDLATAPSITPAPIAPSANARLASRRTESSQIVAWLVVFVGAVALAGGVGLIAWSLSSGEMLHWNLALGLALGGQGTLILGLVLAVSRLWRNSRYASSKLQEVHAKLGQLQQTAEALTAMRSGGAPAFYADLVRGASPHVLLANLKGQVDQLATRVGSGL
jgi:hypothetical protein